MSSLNTFGVAPSPLGGARRKERGAALAMTMLIMALVGVVSIAVLSVVSNEARVAGRNAPVKLFSAFGRFSVKVRTPASCPILSSGACCCAPSPPSKCIGASTAT